MFGTKKCTDEPDVLLRCTVDGGQKVWKGVTKLDDRTPATTCPEDSMPWRNQLMCENTGTTQCFSTVFPSSFGHRKGAVCIIPTSNEPMKTTALGRASLKHTKPISYDRRIEGDELSQFVPCMVHSFNDMSNSAMIAYVPPKERKMCAALVTDALNSCRLAGISQAKCEQLVQPVYTDDRDRTFDCALDTSVLPVSDRSDQREWWRWIRHNQYDCRGAGWKCEDPTLSEYEGGVMCSANADCHATFEAGVCDLTAHKCLVGSTKGTRCSSHEDCDHVSGVHGECGSNGRCEKGKTNVGAAYFAPRECVPDKSDETLHTYCGKMATHAGGTSYTGVCMPFDYDGKTYHGCKAFEDPKKLLQTVADEMDWQAQKRKPNFHPKKPAWQLLQMCPEEDTSIVGGKKVCLHTTRAVHLVDQTVNAIDATEAVKQCSARACTDASCPIGMCTRDRHGHCMPSGRTTHMALPVDGNSSSKITGTPAKSPVH